jgi:hypothetical protein
MLLEEHVEVVKQLGVERPHPRRGLCAALERSTRHDQTHTHSVTRRQGLRHAAKCAPDFFVRGLRAAGVGRFSGPKSSALAMAAAASGVELKVPTCICVLRRGHHTRAVLLSPDLETPLLLPVFVFVWSCSAPIGVVVTAQRPIVKRATSRLKIACPGQVKQEVRS